MRLLILTALLAFPLAPSAQTVNVDFETAPALDSMFGDRSNYAMAPVTAGIAELEWSDRRGAVRVLVDSASVRLESGEAEAPLEATGGPAVQALLDVPGLGLVEIRTFPGRSAVLYRLADARLGWLTVEGETLRVALHRSFGESAYGPRSTLFVDADGDGRFRRTAHADTLGRLLPREGGPVAVPLRIRGSAFSVDTLAADGSKLRLRTLDPGAAPHPGFAAPDAPLVSLTGDTLRVADLLGKTVVLSWWASTCPYCLEEQPMLNEVATAFASDPDVVFLAAGMDGRDAAEAFLARRPYVPEVVLMTGAAESAYEAYSFPRHTVVAPNGQIVFDERGTAAGRAADLRAAIAQAQTGKTP